MIEVYTEAHPESVASEYCLPDAEVLFVGYTENSHLLEELQEKLPGSRAVGWYWHSCFVGDTPDGELVAGFFKNGLRAQVIGPFSTKSEARMDAEATLEYERDEIQTYWNHDCQGDYSNDV